jgi:hypothetical protein
MIKYVDPTFDYTEWSKQLVKYHKSFNEHKEKHKNFLKWASDFYDKVDTRRFKEELNSLEKYSDEITLKDAFISKD